MKYFNRVVFVAQSGTTREPMAKGILEDCSLNRPVEILARGLVVNFPEPINPKADAVLISNGINLSDFTSSPLTEEDLTEDTLVLTMENAQREKILSIFPEADPEMVWVLSDLVGDELEIFDPYGGALPYYGLCYEALRKSIKKLVNIINEGEQ